MLRLTVLAVLVAASACGGAQIPTGNGYRSAKAKPWKQAKHLKFDDKGEVKVKGFVSYPKMRRAAWYAADLPQPGNLKLSVDITPGDATGDDFDLGFEVLDSGYRKVVRQDLEEGDQQGNDTKTADLKDLEAGTYYIHIYLQARLDSADFVLHGTYVPSSGSQPSSDFPAEVAFLPPLPAVPIQDDAPKSYHPIVPVATTHPIHHGHHASTPEPPKPPPPTTKITARIVNLAVVPGGTQITVARGTSNGASVGMAGMVVGVASSSFTLANCDSRTCTATVHLTTDQLKNAFTVQLGQ